MAFDGQFSLESFNSYNFLAVTVNLTVTVILRGLLSGGGNALKNEKDMIYLGCNRKIKAPSSSV